MSNRDLPATEADAPIGQTTGLDNLLARSTQHARPTFESGAAVVRELLALLDNGRTALIAAAPGENVAVRGRTTIDLGRDDVGQQVLALFENGDPQRPVVVGVLRVDRTIAPTSLSDNVEVSADGERMIVNAQRELVLRCGKASISLQQDGTVRIVGERILSRATGPNRVQGGSVLLN
jgi:hypothetical protein